MTDRNKTLFNRTKAIIPGGVSSPVCAFGSVDGVSRFTGKAQGAYVWGENSTCYTDCAGSWGLMTIGRAHSGVIETVCKAALDGLPLGTPAEVETVIAEKVAEFVLSVKQLRLTNSGTEIIVPAIRLARSFTDRNEITRLEDCYHDHSDSLLVKAGSGLLIFGNPSSAGVLVDSAKHMLMLEYNNTAQLEETSEKIDGEVACVTIRLFAGSMNLIRSSGNFIRVLRSLSTRHGTVLIYDKVMTGFRVVFDGVQSLHGITPNLTTMGRVIGGGVPLAAFGGYKDIMACISLLDGVYQAGILSGNPMTVMVGLKALEVTRHEGFYENLTAHTE